ncbi:hypothetical protein ACFW0T_34340, partial [Streptomyces sp. NPDC058989]
PAGPPRAPRHLTETPPDPVPDAQRPAPRADAARHAGGPRPHPEPLRFPLDRRRPRTPTRARPQRHPHLPYGRPPGGDHPAALLGDTVGHPRPEQLPLALVALTAAGRDPADSTAPTPAARRRRGTRAPPDRR